MNEQHLLHLFNNSYCSSIDCELLFVYSNSFCIMVEGENVMSLKKNEPHYFLKEMKIA